MKSDAAVQDVIVKSFEEIMREKRLRRQQEQAASAVEPEQAAQKTIPVLCEKEPPVVISPGIPTQANSAVQQDISHQAASSVPSVVPEPKSPERQNKENSLAETPKKSRQFSLTELPVQVPVIADSLSQHSQEPHLDNTQAVTKMPPQKAAELKGTIKHLVLTVILIPKIRVY